MNPADLLARLAVEALAAAGVDRVLLCPGSRSAPLAYALAAAADAGGPALHVRHDERVAAFTALGVGLAGRSPGAVVTTSGTAVANLHPAVLEAHHANRPLIVLTADRPPALRGTWANQTSELQAGLFGDAVRARLDLGDAEAAKDPDAARAALAACLAALRGTPPSWRPGPVQLNLGFDDPLVPDDEPWPPIVSASAPPRPPALGAAPVLRLPGGRRTVVLAGDGAGPGARAFAETAGLPLLAEPSSGSRGGPNAVGPYRLLLELPDLGGRVEQVVTFGRPTLSRPVTRLLQRPEVEVVLVSPLPHWPDPGRPVTRCRSVTAPGTTTDAAWSAAWRCAGSAAAAAVDAVLDDDAAAGRISGPWVARQAWAWLRPGQRLVAAASNPIRDLDLAASPAPGPAPAVFANRGLSGIDGTLSTASGLALDGVRVRALVGDVAFLHDVGALLLGPGQRRPDLQIVVPNDDGGGIFSLLEHGERAGTGPAAAARFEALFGTPHGADLGGLCRAYGVRHDLLDDVDEVNALLAAPPPGTSVLEVRTDRDELRVLHARLRTAAHRAAARARPA